MSTAKLFVMLGVCAACVVGGHKAYGQSYNYTLISYPTSLYTAPTAINDKGQIAGHYSGQDKLVHGFIWTAGTFATIDPPHSTDTVVTALNNEGDVAGTFRDGKKRVKSFIYRKNAYEIVEYPQKYDTVLTSLNDSGVAVGYASPRNSRGSSNALFLYDHGTFSTIERTRAGITAYIDNAGDVASADFKGLFIYKQGIIAYVKGGKNLQPRSINSAGHLTGVSRTSFAFFYGGHAVTKLTYTPYPHTDAYSINDADQIVGSGETSNGMYAPFVYQDAAFTMLSPPVDPGSAYPLAINNSGQIVSTVFNNGKIREQVFLATPAK